MGGKCEWDVAKDDLVRAALDLETISLVVVVFFVSIDDPSDSLSESLSPEPLVEPESGQDRAKEEEQPNKKRKLYEAESSPVSQEENGEEKKSNKSKKENKPPAKSQSNKGRKTQKRQKPKLIKITETDKLKFFPNLSRRVVLNLTEESDSEPEPEETEQMKNYLFTLKLEAFLKEARNSSKPTQSAVTSQQHPKVVKKNKALTPELTDQASKLTLLEMKKKLIDAKITHLSKTKQEEYVRLKKLREKKQAEKVARKKLKTEAEKENIDEDEEAAQSQENTNKKIVENVSMTQLRALEKDVDVSRKNLSASLSKISDYMSQLQQESSGVDSAVKYIEELKGRLSETEKLLATRKSKVENLKTEIRRSQQQITEKLAISETEKACRDDD